MHSSDEQPPLVQEEIATTPQVMRESFSQPDAAILDDVDDRLICWLPPFNPVVSRPNDATGHATRQATSSEVRY